MKRSRLFFFFLLLVAGGACPWNDELREYLSAHFWLPFAKHPASFEKPRVRRMDAPFAGMTEAQGDTPLARLRKSYQGISQLDPYDSASAFPDISVLRQAVAAARAASSLSPRDREEVDLVEAKIEMRAGEAGDPALLQSARQKLEDILRTVRTPEFRSEARGWLAHIHYVSGEQTAAGKIYLDELNRAGSNLSRETLLNSLRMTYGYDGGPELIAHLDEYFDTPEHAAFAIQLVTNPAWQEGREPGPFAPSRDSAQTYQRIMNLLKRHEALLRSQRGADSLGLLAMRTALRMGDPAGAQKIAAAIPPEASLRASPDFLWMSASAHFLSHDFAGAEQPLLALFRSSRATDRQRAAAAYGLCGVYSKTGDIAGQLRWALWLHTANQGREDFNASSGLSDLSIYWAASGWDLNVLLEAEASTEALHAFVDQNPKSAGIRLVRYSLAVRLSRMEQYGEAADLYAAIGANRRAQRLRQVAALHQAIGAPGITAEQSARARYEFAKFLAANPERVYFNDAVWQGMQRYALQAATDYRLTGAERTRLMEAERELKDSQDERWRAYLILRDVVRDAGPSGTSRDAATLALRCLRGINTERFGREEEIRRADIELSRWLQRASR